MARKFLALLAAVLAFGMAFGTASTASARSHHHRSYGCCGPIAPSYVHSEVYKHITKIRHRDVHYTTRYPRYHHIYYVRHVHVVTNVHTIKHVHHHLVGYRVDVPSHKTVYSHRTIYTNKTYTTTECGCGSHRSHRSHRSHYS